MFERQLIKKKLWEEEHQRAKTEYKGNKTITEHRAIFQRERQNS